MSHDDDGLTLDAPSWPLTWRRFGPLERFRWFDQLWADACMLRERYRLPLRSGWWENDVQVELLAALAAAAARFDSGLWDDPIAKTAWLVDLEHVTPLLRDGADPFHPHRDRAAFVHFVTRERGAQPPPAASARLSPRRRAPDPDERPDRRAADTARHPA